jgi:hypothetical protein
MSTSSCSGRSSRSSAFTVDLQPQPATISEDSDSDVEIVLAGSDVAPIIAVKLEGGDPEPIPSLIHHFDPNDAIDAVLMELAAPPPGYAPPLAVATMTRRILKRCLEDDADAVTKTRPPKPPNRTTPPKLLTLPKPTKPTRTTTRKRKAATPPSADPDPDDEGEDEDDYGSSSDDGDSMDYPRDPPGGPPAPWGYRSRGPSSSRRNVNFNLTFNFNKTRHLCVRMWQP